MNIFQNRKLPKIIIICLIGILLILTVLMTVLNKDAPTKEMANLSEFYGYEEGSAAIIVNGKISGVRALVKNGQPYIRLGLVTDEINTRFFYEPASENLLYTTDSEVITASKGQTFEGSPICIDTRAEGSFEKPSEGIYVLLSYIKQYTNIEVENYQNPSRIFIRSKFGESNYASAKSGANIRSGASLKSPIVTELKEDDSLWIVSSENGWNEVYIGEGYGHCGYISDEELEDTFVKEIKGPDNLPDYSHILYDEHICLVWHQTLSSSGVKDIAALLNGTEDMNVLTPTWFSIDSSDGNVISRADAKYVQIAKEKGLHLWALVENFNTTNKLDYSVLFGHRDVRTRIIETLISECKAYGIEGLNVDFEGLPVSAGDSYIQFMRELSIACRSAGLVLSVDCYVPSAWTMHYHRDRLSEIVDYLIIMAYDEHFEGSDAGSTSSLDFVYNGINDTINEGVPEEIIIPAIPFYSRLWKGEGVTLTSSTIDMNEMKKLMQDHKSAGESIMWDDVTDQYYLEYTDGGVMNRVWIEDARSLTEKLGVISEYNVAGIAGWKLGKENSDAWEAIHAYLQK